MTENSLRVGFPLKSDPIKQPNSILMYKIRYTSTGKHGDDALGEPRPLSATYKSLFP